MEKYYDLVVSLVKNHRKYPEYESILNDIVNDVMQRAETICKSVDDNDVVFSYLVKLVSTSMITVPKKMGVKAMRNYNMNISQVIDAQSPIAIAPAQVESDISLVTQQTTNNHLNLNHNLVDNMINSVKEDAVSHIQDFSSTLEMEEAEEGFAEEEIIDFSQETDDELIQTDSEVLEIEEAEEGFAEEEIIDFSQEADDELIQTDSEVLEMEEAEEGFAEEEIVDFSQELDEQVIEPLEMEGLNALEESLEEPEANKFTQTHGFKIPSFECFKYTPSIESPDYTELIEEIYGLNAKYPEKKIIDIFSLKYKEFKSINEISEQLGLDENTVLETLNEIIYLVKD